MPAPGGADGRRIEVPLFPERFLIEQYLRPLAERSTQPAIDGHAKAHLRPFDEVPGDVAMWQGFAIAANVRRCRRFVRSGTGGSGSPRRAFPAGNSAPRRDHSHVVDPLSSQWQARSQTLVAAAFVPGGKFSVRKTIFRTAAALRRTAYTAGPLFPMCCGRDPAFAG